MIFQSTSRIKKLVSSIDKKMGHRNINLVSAIKILCNQYTGTIGTSYTKNTHTTKVQSCSKIQAILNFINKKTGQADSTLTQAIQRLCDNYVEEEKLYSFGVISDLHIQYNTGLNDFQRALTYLKDKVPFTCICGDLVAYASSDYMAQYKEYATNYKGNMLLYECAGNHESYPSQGVGADIDEALWRDTTGKELYYSFEYENDVFIFVGMKSERANDLFPTGALDWLQTTLETNKNKRCFLFFHAPELADRSADPSGTWASLMGGTSGKTFINIIKQYKNIVWFHGHTHVTLGVEQYPLSDCLGYRSIHIPSLVSPRFFDAENNTLVDYYYDSNNNKIWGSTLAQGYIVDVYSNKIVIRGIDFASGTNKDEVSTMSDEVYVIDTTLV